MSLSDDDLAAMFSSFAVQINRYFSLIVLLFGVIGCCLNTFVFAQRTFRTSPCARLFLASSAASIASLLSGLMGRVVAGWGVDPAGRNTWLCKLRTIVDQPARCAAMWLIVLASIDRWLCSCSKAHYRQMSSLKNAIRSIFFTLLLAVIIHIPHTICYEPFQLAPMPQRCYGATTTCRLFDDIFYASITVLIPCSLMLIFGCMTINNIHHSRRTVRPIPLSISITQRTRILPSIPMRNKIKNERNLTKMLLVQVFVLSLFTVPHAGESLYATITYGTNKSLVRTNLDQFLYNLALLLSYVAAGLPFYLYTISGKIFRTGLIQLLKRTFFC